MPTKSKAHTPTPWKIDKYGCIVDGNNKLLHVQGWVGKGPLEIENANASFIVRSCNNYESMLYLLQSIKLEGLNADNQKRLTAILEANKDI